MTSLESKRHNHAWLTAFARWIGKQRRTDSVAQMYSILLQSGIYSQNEVRALENFNRTILAPKRRNPAWLAAIARWIGQIRRARQLRQQNFSENAIKGLLG